MLIEQVELYKIEEYKQLKQLEDKLIADNRDEDARVLHKVLFTYMKKKNPKVYRDDEDTPCYIEGPGPYELCVRPDSYHYTKLIKLFEEFTNMVLPKVAYTWGIIDFGKFDERIPDNYSYMQYAQENWGTFLTILFKLIFLENKRRTCVYY